MGKPVVQTALFPIVGPRGVELQSVHVERLGALDQKERFAIAPGFPDVIDILMDARAGDDPASRLDGVTVVFSGKGFGGRSYGLALAIADKRARTIGSPSGPVVATGCIAPRSRGAVDGVEGFEAKAIAVAAFAAAQTEAVSFAFPAVNWRDTDPEVREQLEEAQRSGTLRLFPCEEVKGASPLWRVVNRARRRAIVALATVLAIAIGIGAVTAWHHASLRDVRGCQAAAAALPDADPAPDAVAAAVRLCTQAAAGFPRDGRIQFLLGQVLALNGSDVMAGGAWERAAELGDRDGMAAWGRQLWQSNPGDRATVDAALAWLKRASALGSVAATEDVGYVLMDGTVPGGAEKAQQWLVKARAMRAAAPKE